MNGNTRPAVETAAGQRSRSHPVDVRPLNRTVAALLMPIGPAVIAVIRLVIPPPPVGESVAANPGAQRLVLALGVVAVFTLLPGVLAALRLLRPHAPVLTTWTGAILVPAYLCMMALGASDYIPMVGTDLGLDPAMLSLMAESLFAMPTYAVMILIFVVGHIVGTVLLGITAYRTRLVPRIVAVLLAASQVIHLVAVVITNPWLDFLGWGLTAVGMGFLAWRVLRAPDSQWDVGPVQRSQAGR